MFYVLAGLQNCNKQLFASSCPPVHVHETAGLSLNSFHEIGYCSVFLKSVKKIQVSLKYDQNAGTAHEDL